MIEDVVNGVREAFLDEGVDEAVLLELKQIWENKLAASKAIEPLTDPAESSLQNKISQCNFQNHFYKVVGNKCCISYCHFQLNSLLPPPQLLAQQHKLLLENRQLVISPFHSALCAIPCFNSSYFCSTCYYDDDHPSSRCSACRSYGPCTNHGPSAAGLRPTDGQKHNSASPCSCPAG